MPAYPNRCRITGTLRERPHLGAFLKRTPAFQHRRRLDKAIARSRNVHGKSNQSNRRERLYAKRRRLHARIVNVRNDNHHKATTAITKSAGRVVVETLNVAGMMRNRRLARAIVDAGMAGFLVKLEYKCDWYGADFEKADQWFPSVPAVRSLRIAHAEMTLSDRQWYCGGCGGLVERDCNAALNLERWPSSSFQVFRRRRMETV